MQTQMNPKAIKLTKKTRSLLFFLYLFSKKIVNNLVLENRKKLKYLKVLRYRFLFLIFF